MSSDESDIEQLKYSLVKRSESKLDRKIDKIVKFLSAPNTPQKSEQPVLLERAVSFSNLSKIFDDKMPLKEEFSALRKKRAPYRAQVTKNLTQMKEKLTAGSLSLSSIKRYEETVNQKVAMIESFDEKIDALYDKYKESLECKDRTEDYDEVQNFIMVSKQTIADYEAAVIAAATPKAPQLVDPQKLVIESKNSTTVVLDCKEFHGSEIDKLRFGQWLPQLNTVIKNNPNWDEAAKLTYLKSKVKGAAGNVIRPINEETGTFSEAIEALKKQYLNVSANKDQLLSKIYSNKPSYCNEYIKLEQYIAEVRANLLDLKNHYSCDLTEEKSGGYQFVSHLIFSKLPFEFQNALINKVSNSYPTWNHIYEHHVEIINNLRRYRRKKNEFIPKNKKPQHNPAPANNSDNFATATAKVNMTNNDKKYHCRLCIADGHTSSHCNVYPNIKDRRDRCVELKLCTLCTLANHAQDKCFGKSNQLKYPCKLCNSSGHVTAMCDQVKPRLHNVKQESNNICLNTNMQNQSNFLLPIIKIGMRGHNGKIIYFNCLLDTASSRSYISNKISDQMGLIPKNVSEVQYNVKTFIGSGLKSLKEATIDVFLPSGRYLLRSILIENDFNVELNVRGLKESLINIKSKGYVLQADLDKPILGLIGTDCLQFIKEFKTVDCMNGSAYSVRNGIMPFGDTTHFLFPGQVPLEKHANRVETNFKTIIDRLPSVPQHSIDFCLNPKTTYDDPQSSFFPESSVERNIDNTVVVNNLENMFKLESIGIVDSPDEISNYDQEMIKKFEKGIEIKDGQVHVELLWKPNVNDVPSNHDVALKICNIVSNKLDRKGELEAYNQIFKDQVKEDMVEEFECHPSEFGRYNWLPHHPVYKQDDNSTFKTRPVFNASLKSDKNKPSLNESAYQGINNMQDMLALIMLFRSNKYSLLGDLRKAFLQIKLKLIEDRNRFCFFLKEGNVLKCYRYKTLIFGFCTSPFILNHVLKYIADLGNQDDCANMIKNNFFVDNLAKSSNDLVKLTNLYKECSDRLGKNHFDLRSCNTNSETLRNIMKNDDRLITHNNKFDKVLGYNYSATNDTMSLSDIKVDAKADTHRKILAEIAKVFDPLNFTCPVTVRGKSLLGSLWKLRKTGGTWDKVVSSETQKGWSNLAKDLEGLSSLEFPRNAIDQDQPADLMLFTDASSSAFGYVMYAKQNDKSNFLIAKCKAAPIKKKTLPTLELLGVYLALQGLTSHLKTYQNYNINSVTVAVDSQVALQWVLSDIGKCRKNVFVNNRLKDIKAFEKQIFELYNVKINYKYVPTNSNPADLLTRGLTLDKFKQNLRFWLHGPSFINQEYVQWPISNLSCLSKENQNVVMSTQLENAPSESVLIKLERYSTFSAATRVAANVIKFCSERGRLSKEKMQELWGSTDYKECAKVYLIKAVQHHFFVNEIEFLKDPRDKQIPDLVRNFNLFLDHNNIVRSDCRVGKSEYFAYEVLNPILLPKVHHLTNLIILDAHSRIKHLGIQATLNKVRLNGFRLIKPYMSVRTVISPCITCKRFNALAYKYPKMTNLPEHRVNMIDVYGHCGIDYTGHFLVKDKFKIKNKVYEVERKYYILIFTCLNTRACHLELIPEMSTDHFVLALVRFFNEYGVPSHIYSDNARSFISGVHVMERVYLSNLFKEKFGMYNIEHVKIPVYSPWVGATWERLIRTVKNCLKKTISRSKLNYFQLKTVLSDIEVAVNSRPLTYRCASDDGLEILTPNKFLRPNVESNLILRNPKEVLKEPATRKDIVKSLDIREKLITQFKTQWHEDYLLSLRSLYRNLHETDFTNQIQVNDLVVIKNPVKGRQHWRLGRVIELIHGSDGKVRSVKLLRGDAKWRTKERKLELHSVKNLYPLELSITHKCNIEKEIDPNILNLEVEDHSEMVNDQLEQSIDSNFDESLIDNLEDNFGYTNELSREEIESFQEHDNAQDIVVPQTEENTETAGQDRSPDSISEESVPIVSSRGRVIRRPGRPMDDEFTWE